MTVPEVRLSALEYRLLVENSPVLIWRSGLDAKCDYFNDTWLAFTGRTLQQELGDGWAQGVHPDDQQPCFEVYLKHFERRTAFEMEYRLRRHDGVYRYIFDRGVPCLIDGQFVGFIGSCVDIDERRRSDDAKRTFLSMLAHELRTPLAPLRVLPALFERRAHEGVAVGRDLTSLLRRQVERFSAVVEQFTEITETGRQKTLVLTSFELGAFVDELVSDRTYVLSATPGNKHQLSAQIAPGSYPVHADKMRVGQVIHSFLDNAIKYSPEGGSIRVQVCMYKPGTSAVSVEDQGIGIPPHELTRVGQKFFRASNASDKNFPGVGLGLAISKQTLEQHGGALLVENGSSGARVTALLPARGVDLEAAIDRG